MRNLVYYLHARLDSVYKQRTIYCRAKTEKNIPALFAKLHKCVPHRHGNDGLRAAVAIFSPDGVRIESTPDLDTPGYLVYIRVLALHEERMTAYIGTRRMSAGAFAMRVRRKGHRQGEVGDGSRSPTCCTARRNIRPAAPKPLWIVEKVESQLLRHSVHTAGVQLATCQVTT